MAHSLNDPSYVKKQYQHSSNLEARAALHERFRTAPRPWFDWYFDHLDLPANARVLEVGCGTGVLWRENTARVPGSWQLTLTDFSPGMLETAQRAIPAARFVATDTQALAFEWGEFDAVIANHMLYHVPDVTRALAEFKRVLRPRGKLFAATNGVNHLRELRALIGNVIGLAQPFLEMQFNLENGADYLAHYFSTIRRFDFEDRLIVTEVEPLVAYPMSGVLSTRLRNSDGESTLRQIVADHIAREGAFVITKSTGLFVCA